MKRSTSSGKKKARNATANIVICYFEDYKNETGKVIKIGSRNAEILKEFLGDAKIHSMQSDSCASLEAENPAASGRTDYENLLPSTIEL